MRKLAGVLALVLLSSGAAAFAADRASIGYIDGDVTMNGSPASVGDDVLPGATLKTAPDAVCQVVFNRKNIVHMAGGTILTFDPRVLSQGATLQKGAVAMVLRNLAGATNPGELRFRIKTSNAVAGVRGTCFFVSVEDENNTFICCCNGVLRLQDAGGDILRNLAGSHHQEVRVTRTAQGISAAPAPMLYHTDADVEAIASRIGETIDWTKIDR
jgi:hypothetical protein